MPDVDNMSVLQIDGNHHSVRPTSVAAERHMLHEIEHVSWSLSDPGIESPSWLGGFPLRHVLRGLRIPGAEALFVRRKFVVDQPEVVLTIPQRKSLLTECAANARDRGLYRSIPALVPPWSEFAFVEAENVPWAAVDFAAFLLASAYQKRACCDDDMGEYKCSDFGGQS
jgi:hypothetical protein